ncbi:hypothetical protein ABBQ32_002092 [Trebouxia sp. C0010 RCD-2024]
MVNPSNVLTQANNNACMMLVKMTTPAEQGIAKTNAIIPLPSLRDCSGLQFFDLKLVGAVASYLHGSAFTIRKLGKQDGATQWSAPCFLQMHQIGLGLTVGYDDVKTIVVLGSDAALRKAQGTRSLVGADLDVIVGKDSAVVQSDVSQTQAIPYSMADGALIDFSVKGGRVTVDDKLNKQLYGPSVTVDHILAGDVDTPEEMRPLYNAIHRLIVQAGTSV